MTRTDAIFDIELTINGETAQRRFAVRWERGEPSVADLEDWMRAERAGLSRHAAVAEAINYMMARWDGFARFLDDGRICHTKYAVETACVASRSDASHSSSRAPIAAARPANAASRASRCRSLSPPTEPVRPSATPCPLSMQTA